MIAASTRPASLAARVAQARPLVWIFNQGGDWEACKAAEAFLKGRGFSIGVMQSPEPRGILFGASDIRQWRQLRKPEREALHGVMTGSMRCGPVKVEIFATAPATAITALGRKMARP